MSPLRFSDYDALETVELLSFVAELCQADAAAIDTAICRYLGDGYYARDLRVDAMELADRLAQALGFADATLEKAP